jgi:hypothetical protein
MVITPSVGTFDSWITASASAAALPASMNSTLLRFPPTGRPRTLSSSRRPNSSTKASGRGRFKKPG